MNEQTISAAAQSGLARIFDFLPQLLGALLLLIIGYFVAKLLCRLTTKALQLVRFDRLLLDSPAGRYVAQVMETPSAYVGIIVYWLVFLGFVSLAVSVLNIQALNAFIGTIYAYLPHIIVSIIIFLVAGAVSVTAVSFVERVIGKTAFAKTIATVIPSLVMSIAVFMILNELMIAPAIVTITYTALIGAVALGLALAFGLGGRDMAARLLDQAYEAGRRDVSTTKHELEHSSHNDRIKASTTGRRNR